MCLLIRYFTHALEVCDDDILKLAINLAFSCSLRMGELLGLTWDCCEISEESIAENNASIYINKELQRCNKDAALIAKLLSNPEAKALLKALASSL